MNPTRYVDRILARHGVMTQGEWADAFTQAGAKPPATGEIARATIAGMTTGPRVRELAFTGRPDDYDATRGTVPAMAHSGLWFPASELGGERVQLIPDTFGALFDSGAGSWADQGWALSSTSPGVIPETGLIELEEGEWLSLGSDAQVSGLVLFVAARFSRLEYGPGAYIGLVYRDGDFYDWRIQLSAADGPFWSIRSKTVEKDLLPLALDVSAYIDKDDNTIQAGTRDGQATTPRAASETPWGGPAPQPLSFAVFGPCVIQVEALAFGTASPDAVVPPKGGGDLKI